MKWFFCWCQASEFRDDHNWPALIQAAVASARRNTSLEPNFIYEGAPSALTDQLTARGVNVIFHRLSFADAIERHRPNEPAYGPIARGAFLRFDIPLVADASDEIVLYTDADVMFMDDPDFTGYAPEWIGAAPQFARGGKSDMNSGVMLLNLKTFRRRYDDLIRFTIENFHLGFDQEVLRAFIGRNYLLLPDIYNWKPYWGVNQDASIVHWHGPKPETIGRLLDGRQQGTHPGWQPLFESDRAAYAHYLADHRRLIDHYHTLEEEQPISPHTNLALGRPATQSSISQWSTPRRPEADAAGAVTGIITGGYGFHTGFEDQPWWMVDLGEVFGIQEVRIFNRLDNDVAARRACRLAIEVGIDRNSLAETYRYDNEKAFGGADGAPLVYRPLMPALGRYVRVRLLHREYLHLDQVEVFGDRLPVFLRGLL